MDPRINEGSGAKLSPETRRQIRLQLILPLVIGLLMIVAVAIWIFFAGYGSTSVWADLAVILLAIPMLFLGLILLAVLVVLTYAVGHLIGVLPTPLRRAHRVAARSAREARRGGDLAAKPFVAVPAVWSSLSVFMRRVWAIFVPSKERDYE